MRTIVWTAVVLTLTGARHVRADEKADARAIIAKAVRVKGGEEKLARDKAATFKGKGKFYGMGDGTEYTGEWAVQPPDKARFRIEFEANAMKFTYLFVFAGDKGWIKLNDQTTELNEAGVAEAKEDMYAGQVERLVPLLRDKDFQLSPLGEVKIDDHPAVGVRVAHQGHRDIKLFFDKQTGLLLKSERTIKDETMGGKERVQETAYGDYRSIDGVQYPMKLVVKRDGDKYVESALSNFEPKEKLDESLFAKP